MSSVGQKNGESLSLNLTPMLDIFSILVTFLLMSYSTDPISHDLDPNLELPSSMTLVSLDAPVTITVSKIAILINDTKIVDLVNGDVPENDKDQGGIRSVFDALDKIGQNSKKAVSRMGIEEKVKSETLTMEVDNLHKYKLVKRIMLSAQQADFIKFKLVVTKNSNS